MKISSLLLAGTALPFLVLSPAVASTQVSPASPLVVAQGAPVERLPRARHSGQDQPDSDEAAPQRRGPPGHDRGPDAPGEGHRRGPESRPEGREAPGAPQRPNRGEPPRPQAQPAPAAEHPANPAQAPSPQPARPAQAPEPARPKPEERPAPAQAAPKPEEKPAPAQAAPQQPAQPARQSEPKSQRSEPPAPAARPAPSTPAAETPAPKVAPQPAPSATAPQPARPGGSPPAGGAQAPSRERQSDAPRPPEPSAPKAQQPAQAPAAAAPTAPTPPTGSGSAAGRDTQSFDAFQQGRIDELRRQRRERTEEGGRRVIIEEPGDRTIVREGDRSVIWHDETDRFRRSYGNADVRQEQRGSEDITIVRRSDGTEIVSVRDADGRLVRRIRRDPAGREVVLIDNRRGGGHGRTFIEETVRLPPPVVRIPRDEYVVDVEDASQDQIYEAFTAPPVERLDRAYTLDEIRLSAPLRERMRRVDLDTVTFDTGSWQLPPEQIGAMTGIAQAIRRALDHNPNEIFLVEGHTDAVGSDEDNLTLSDRRAETVATILSDRFGIPAENLTTQGYGEQYLKIDTQGAERRNRRVTIRRITPLLHGAQR